MLAQPKIAIAEDEFLSLEDIVEIKDKDDASANSFYNSRKCIEMRAGRPIPADTAINKYTGRVNPELLKMELEKLADSYFSDSSYQLRVMGEDIVYAEDPKKCININVDIVSYGVAKGKVEFCFGKGFDKKLGATALFIEELARYIGADTGFSSEHILKLAYLKTPDNYLLREGQYKISFEFDPSKTTVSFIKEGSNAPLVRREYLDQDVFRFTLGKYSKDMSRLVFERYIRRSKRLVDGAIPKRVLGPDLVWDDVLETTGCLENYLVLDKAVVN